MRAAPAKTLIVGTGSWGTALAVMLAQFGPVALLCQSREERERLQADGSNRRLLDGFLFPGALQLVDDPEAACRPADLVLMVVPTARMRSNARWLRPYLGPDHVVLSAAKGFEPGSRLRMTEVLQDELGESSVVHLGALSGPNLAREVAAGKPATSVVASSSDRALSQGVSALTTPLFRVYANRDILGVETAGALKNVIAIGAGAVDGLDAGNNTKAAFVTRGLAEISRFGVASGAHALTFAGLAGLGDLLATVSSDGSRNRFVGQEFARGRSLDEIRASLAPQVAEGIETTRTAYTMAAERDVEMPILDQTYKVMFEGKPVPDAVAELMLRDPKFELELV